MSNEKLPKTLYVYMQEDEESFFPIAFRGLRECGDMDEARTVGRYVLEETGTLAMEHSFEPDDA